MVPQLGAGELLPRLEEQIPLAGEIDQGSQPVGGKHVLVPRGEIRLLPVHGQHQLIPEGEVVVGGNVIDNLTAA